MLSPGGPGGRADDPGSRPSAGIWPGPSLLRPLPSLLRFPWRQCVPVTLATIRGWEGLLRQPSRYEPLGRLFLEVDTIVHVVSRRLDPVGASLIGCVYSRDGGRTGPGYCYYGERKRAPGRASPFRRKRGRA
jgi:hypothetical protein